MEDSFRPLLRQKILDAQAARLPGLTRRDVWCPAVAGKALAVIGMRRAGKTSFLWQLLADRHAQGTAREGLLYFSFEDERLAGMRTADLDLLVEEYFSLHPQWRDGQRCTFFLDEIQLVSGWELFVRRLLDTENIELFVSGSSAKLLSREVATSMRGRALEAVVTPFSFREALRHRGEEPTARAQRLTAAARSTVEKRLREYLVAGGFPEAQGSGKRPLDRATRIALLQGYVDTVLFRDVIERHAVSQVAALRWIIRHALRNPCGSFSATKLHDDLRSQGHNVAKDTVHSLLDHLIDAFVIAAVPVATDSERRRNTNPRKVYPADPGLIDAFDTSGRSNTGHALETAVYNELSRRGADVSYVKTKGGFEVDFLARHPGGRQELIQVCADATDAATWQRETRALDAAHAEHPRSERLVITLDASGARALSHPKTQVLPAHQWLLTSE